MARGRNNKLRKGERAAAKMGMPTNPLDILPTPASTARSRLTATIEEKKHHSSTAPTTAARRNADATRLNAYLADIQNGGPPIDYANTDGWYKDDDGWFYAGGNIDDYYDDEDDEHYYYDDDEIDPDECIDQDHHHDHAHDPTWADEDDDYHSSRPRSPPLSYGWGRRDTAAASRSSQPPPTSKTAASSTRKGSPPDPLDDEDLCDHTHLMQSRMRTVTSLLNDIFCASFKMATPSLYRGMVVNLQDEIMRDQLMQFIDNGLAPKAIRNMATDPLTRQAIKSQLKLACQDELGDVVLRLSTEDAFDLLCDLAMRHGRNLRTWGPPCACSFSHCLPCLERLVNTVKSTPPPKDYSLYSNPALDSTSRLAIAAAAGKASEEKAKKGKGRKGGKPGSRTVPPLKLTSKKPESTTSAAPSHPLSKLGRRDLMDWIAGLIEADWVDKRKDWVDVVAWEADIWAAWQSMNDLLWDVADEIEPISLSRVAEYLAGLGEMNGLDLYYAVVTRELTYNPAVATKKPDPARSEGSSPAKVTAEAISWEGVYERMKKEVRELRRKQRAEERGKGRADGQGQGPGPGPNLVPADPSGTSMIASLRTDLLDSEEDEFDDVEGSDYRRALARAVREQGNAAYELGSYFDAVDHYTRAIGYDMTEPIYPLNRAASLLKLRLFEDAERDCSAAIRLDGANHKAYFRRGASRAGLGKVALARQDFDEVMRLQSGTPEVLEELRMLADKFIAEAPVKPAAKWSIKKSGTGMATASLSSAAKELNEAVASKVEAVLDEAKACLKAELKRQAKEDAKERFRRRKERTEAEAAERKGKGDELVQKNKGGTVAVARTEGIAPELSDSEGSRHVDEDGDDSDGLAPSSATSDMAQGREEDKQRRRRGRSSRSTSSSDSRVASASEGKKGGGRRQAELDEIRRRLTELQGTLGPSDAPTSPSTADLQQRPQERTHLANETAAELLRRYQDADHKDEVDEAVHALLTNPSETVACWTTFAFVFSLIVAQKTGIDVPERLGFVREYPAGGGGCGVEAMGMGSSLVGEGGGEGTTSLMAELQRAAKAEKLLLGPASTTTTATANSNGARGSLTLNDTLELLRSVPLEEHLDRIVNFLRQPEVQPVLVA
ncbi:unnamed protein product [Tilletia laevis]|uniref:Uncharacterized protein n=1 Tax=Tilletia caries TaxID=13290 RepID=A0A177UQL8_9BASI|nr:hypothetical protein CF336_g2368 [Tilletia laevis]KAE8258685.1 hypothetical protein A4X03_0g4307 [Tilletia caries]CAD6909182.1 unnamed protein product [Tilletia controversa]CAD6884294.1 unnamed protein product [Tilletia caries]CAD6900044.1 unnamed protein product [Tilletia caries]